MCLINGGKSIIMAMNKGYGSGSIRRKNTGKIRTNKRYGTRNIVALLLIVFLAFNVVFTINSFFTPDVFADNSSQMYSEAGTASTETVSITFKDADLRDILSAIALTMNVNIILAEEPVTTSFSISNVYPRTALTYLLKTLGM